MSDSTGATLFGTLTLVFLLAFWFSPGGVLALRRAAGGALQADLRPGYRPDSLYELLQVYGPAGIRQFRTMLIADLVFPAVYATTLYIFGNLLAATSPDAATAVAWTHGAAVAAGIFDYAENGLLLAVLQKLPARRDWLARAAGTCTTLKVASLMIALLALIVGHVRPLLA